jgi:DNA gyrase/topoisomerase IV subunit A
MLISSDGTIIRMPATDINVYKRDTQGVIVMRVENGSKVMSIEKVDSEKEEPAEETTETV